MTNLHREYIGHQVTETQGVREEGAEGDTVSTVYTRANHSVSFLKSGRWPWPNQMASGRKVWVGGETEIISTP